MLMAIQTSRTGRIFERGALAWGRGSVHWMK
jgi:hypothetical protein